MTADYALPFLSQGGEDVTTDFVYQEPVYSVESSAQWYSFHAPSQGLDTGSGGFDGSVSIIPQ